MTTLALEYFRSVPRYLGARSVGAKVPGLVAGLFGTRRWMAEIGRRGGKRRTKAKALAARANGAKGGRPRRR